MVTCAAALSAHAAGRAKMQEANVAAMKAARAKLLVDTKQEGPLTTSTHASTDATPR
jgi:hypothetical protein